MAKKIHCERTLGEPLCPTRLSISAADCEVWGAGVSPEAVPAPGLRLWRAIVGAFPQESYGMLGGLRCGWRGRFVAGRWLMQVGSADRRGLVAAGAAVSRNRVTLR